MKRKIFLIAAVFLMIAGCSKPDKPLPGDEGRIIVLMYHRVVSGEATNLYERSVEDFEADLKYLRDNDINVISFNDLEKAVSTGKMPEGHSAIITFDDGDHSWYTLVKPLLLEYRMEATFFLWTYMIGHDSFLNWNEIEDMSYYTLAGGERPFVFGSHTFSHTYLLQRKAEFATDAEYNSFLDYEFRESRALIETYTPDAVTVLSLPYGDGAGDNEIITAAKRNGFKFIRTSVWAAVNDPSVNLFAIPSLPILDTTEPELIGVYLGL
jgi:peptidoglycan/xylan/chitin deacetylase (PgdA/CDA1 family)